MKFTLGTDPELFLSLGGKFVSAAGMFPGTKWEPFDVEKGAVQVDGLALEFNIHPAETATEFNNNIETVLSQIKEMAVKVDRDLKLNFTPFAKFDKRYFSTLDEHTKMLGCNPDFNVMGAINEAPEIMEEPIRTAAGHMHIGWSKDEDPNDPIHFADCQFVANFFHKNRFDSYYDARTPLEKKRIKYYGGNGAFRPKTYGVELRGPSNLWVESSETRIEMFNHTMKFMESLQR